MKSAKWDDIRKLHCSQITHRNDRKKVGRDRSVIFFSLSPDLRDIKGMKLECMSCQINNIPSEALTSLTRQPFYNHGLDKVHEQGNKR